MIISGSKPTTGSKPTIRLQTRKGTDINNYQLLGVDVKDYEAQMEKLRRQHPGIILRPDTISGIYNCHGMTFASRRTGINKITMALIAEDSFNRINDSEVLPGDVVLYIDSWGEIEHTGFITSVDLQNRSNFTIMVLSKWGDGSEVIHSLYNCPYAKENIQFFRCKN